AKPLDQEITSQGYCYQALVFMYLIKNGVKPNEMDTYINFLTEFAFHLFTERKVELPIVEFNAFFQSYQDQYNLPVPEEKLINNLISSKLLCLTDLGNYGFIYNYLYYFFVAKYIADNIEKNKPYVDNILKNLHIDENAYIAIFISHHSKNNYILDELTLNAMCLFDTFCPATLNKKELLFFDEQIEVIANAVLPTTTPETERRKRLSAQQIKEENNKPCNNSTQNNENDLTRNDIRRAVKTVEVMGQVIKNRAGSLKREILEEIFREAILTNLRMLSSFFECIQKKKEQDSIINFITSRIDIVSEKKNDKRRDEGKKSKEISEEELEEIARKVFWNLNFFVVLGIIDKTVKSTGSDQLTQIIIKVCDEIDTPASELIKHGIFMWYSKNLQIDIISDKFDNVDYSFISKQIMRYMIVNHCSLHTVSFKEKQKLEKRFGISHKKLLVAQAQKSQDIK
ncbi:MAG: toll-Interleukin receptor, partial [Tissierellales bacterium]|nr:toll-Interleukin receptor [Tissierellales bacterium]